MIAGLEGSTDVRWARQVWAELRESVGYRKAPAALLTSGASQQKLSKNSLPSFGLMLTPERGMMARVLRDVRDAFGLSGGINLCPMASKGCAQRACHGRDSQVCLPSSVLKL